jgi:hypothetical protein
MKRQGHSLLSACLLLTTPAFALGPNAPFEPPRAASASALAAAVGSHPLPGNAATDGLTGVRLSGAAAAALIDGRWWPVGSTLRGARLVDVQRHQVLLRHADGRVEPLALHPAAAPATSPRPPATPR